MSTASKEQIWTVGDLLGWTARYLAQKGSDSPRLDAEVLLAKALECKRIDLYGARFGEVADDAVRERYRELIRKRIEGCPVAYLVGRKEFFSLEFEVSPAVLIPRPDSEALVMAALDVLKKLPAPQILDIGTGSGNLAVVLAHHLPAAQVTAVDRSPEALAVAQRNAVKHGVAERVRFVEGDLFAPLAAEARFDAIVSNPPYIPHGDIAKLAVGVREYEPHTALDGGPDGYAILTRLAAEAPRYLHEGGYLIVEIGAPQEERVRAIIAQHACYQLGATLYDMSKHPRVLRARHQV